MMMDLEDFFNSYDLCDVRWDVKHKGIVHYVDAQTLKASVLGKSSAEQNRIAGTLRSLIFRGMPLEVYLEALAIDLVNEAHNPTNL